MCANVGNICVIRLALTKLVQFWYFCLYLLSFVVAFTFIVWSSTTDSTIHLTPDV